MRMQDDEQDDGTDDDHHLRADDDNDATATSEILFIMMRNFHSTVPVDTRLVFVANSKPGGVYTSCVIIPFGEHSLLPSRLLVSVVVVVVVVSVPE